MITSSVSLHFKADSMWAYFNNLNWDNFPSPEKLFQAALLLYDNYSCPKASMIFVMGCPNSSAVLVGESWKEEEDTELKVVLVVANNVDTRWGEGEDRLGEDEGKLVEDQRFDGDQTLVRLALLIYEALALGARGPETSDYMLRILRALVEWAQQFHGNNI